MPARYEVFEEALDELEMTILLNGPMTLYDARKALLEKAKTARRTGPEKQPNRYAMATVDRHLKMLKEEGEITVYRTQKHKSGQIKKFYGLTPLGFLMSFTIPGQVAKNNFTNVMKIWLRERRFRFFLPNDEVLSAIDNREVETHLASLCQMVADIFPEAEDLAEYLMTLGFGQLSLPDIIAFTASLSAARYGEQFVETSRVLARHLPSYRTAIRQYISAQRSNLDRLESQVLGGS
jgi:hypothetical protein